MSNLTFEKILKEVDLFPELGMSTCQASLVFEHSRHLTLSYDKGKLTSALLLEDEAPRNIIANAVLMNNVPRHLPTNSSVVVAGVVASMRPYKELYENDRMIAFQTIPNFDFWATKAQATAGTFTNDREERLWLDQAGFRLYPVYEVQGSQGLKRLAQASQEDLLGPLPPYIRRDYLLVSELTVYPGSHLVKIPEPGELT